MAKTRIVSKKGEIWAAGHSTQLPFLQIPVKKMRFVSKKGEIWAAGLSTQLPSFCSSLITSLTPVGFKSAGHGWGLKVKGKKCNDKNEENTKMWCVHLSLTGHISILADRLPVSLSLNTSPRVSRHFHHQSSFSPFFTAPNCTTLPCQVPQLTYTYTRTWLNYTTLPFQK